MIATQQETRARRRQLMKLASARRASRARVREPDARNAPILAAVEPQTAYMTAVTAARLARELRAPLVFVSVRPHLSAALGHPNYQRRLTRDLLRSRKALDAAIAAASRHGVMSYGEILEGDVATTILDYALARSAQLLVLGSRRRRLVPSISRRVIDSSEQPVVIAPMAQPAQPTVGDRQK